MSKEKMTVSEFINQYSGNTGVLEIKSYVPLDKKLEAIDKLIKTVIESDGNVVLTYSSIAYEVGVQMVGIELYTNLSFDDNSDYDVLVENGLLDYILGTIGNDYAEFERYSKMRMDDYLHKMNTLDNVIARTYTA